MKLAIMQPYFFPYIGYFQLINAVDKFVFYDDVNFIKNGWINRNQINLNGERKYVTVALRGASSFKKINEVQTAGNCNKLLKTIEQSYSKAPYFNIVFPIVEKTLKNVDSNSFISDIAEFSVKATSMYLGINTNFEKSSKRFQQTTILSKSQRLIEICNQCNARIYINSIGGLKLYNREYFQKKKIDIYFLKSMENTYQQYGKSFVSNLSIIDVMMFNSKLEIQKMLNNYKLL